MRMLSCKGGPFFTCPRHEVMADRDRWLRSGHAAPELTAFRPALFCARDDQLLASATSVSWHAPLVIIRGPRLSTQNTQGAHRPFLEKQHSACRASNAAPHGCHRSERCRSAAD